MIIGLCGQKQSGKSTAASILEERYGFERASFAGVLKKAVKDIFLLTDDQLNDPEEKERVDHRWGKTPRQIMQLFGTEVGRSIDPDVWVKHLEMTKFSKGGRLVIDDCRFLNEAQAIQAAGGIVIGVTRRTWPEPSYAPDPHASETEMLAYWDKMVSWTISNDATIEDLHDHLASILFHEKLISEPEEKGLYRKREKKPSR
jgi:hypothetical protein